MNPAMFGNLGNFNYGGLGDSPALAPMMSQLNPMQIGQLYPQVDPTSNQLQNFLKYISGVVQGPNPRMMMGGDPMSGGLSGDEPPAFFGGGIRG